MFIPIGSPVTRALTLWLLLLGGITPAVCQEWTRFRGPNGSGIATARSIPTTWTDSDYNWTVKLPGKGHSSPVVYIYKWFVTAGDEESGERRLVCVHVEDGRTLWSRSFQSAAHRKHQLNSFATSTPAVDESRIYLTWATPEEHIVLALDPSGRDLWRRDLGPFKSGHGYGVSPIVHEGLVVVANEHSGDSSLVALDAGTGEIRWQLARQSKTTYSTPCIYHPSAEEAELIFVNYEHGVTAVDPRSGKVRWELDVFDKGHIETSIASPIVAGELILATSGWLGVRQEVVAVRPGKPQPQVAYTIDRSAPLTPTPLAKDGLLYMMSDQGIASCADAATGEVHWRKRLGGTYYGSPVWAGGHVYCISVDGEVVVLAASPEYELVARVPLGEPTNSTPAVADGVMYLRTLTQLRSLGGRKSESP